MKINSKANPEVHALDLGVTVQGLQIVVAPGTFKISRVAYTLPESIGHTVTPSNDRALTVTGFLETDKDGIPDLVVDESEAGDEIGYTPPADRKLLHRLFDLQVAPGATEINEDDLRVYAIVAPPKEESETTPEGGPQ